MTASDDRVLRLKELMAHLNINQSSLARQACIDNGTLTKVFQGKRQLTREAVAKIVLAFSNISADWLYDGKGPMLKKDVDYMTKLCRDSEKVLADIEQMFGETTESLKRLSGLEHIDDAKEMKRSFTYKEVRALLRAHPDLNVFWVMSHDKSEPIRNESAPGIQPEKLQGVVEAQQREIEDLKEILKSFGGKV